MDPPFNHECLERPDGAWTRPPAPLGPDPVPAFGVGLPCGRLGMTARLSAAAPEAAESRGALPAHP